MIKSYSISAHEQTTTTEIPGIHRGMKEVVMLRPATGTKSPFTDFIERYVRAVRTQGLENGVYPYV